MYPRLCNKERRNYKEVIEVDDSIRSFFKNYKSTSGLKYVVYNALWIH
jgi:hypothetical protein